MEIIYEMTGDIMVAQLFGELDHHAAEKVRGDIDEMLESYCKKHLIFDFGRVTFMDSAGIGVVLGRYKRLQAVGGMVAITECSPRIRSILNMAGIFSLMEYTETKDDAIVSLSGKEVS